MHEQLLLDGAHLAHIQVTAVPTCRSAIRYSHGVIYLFGSIFGAVLFFCYSHAMWVLMLTNNFNDKMFMEYYDVYWFY